MEIDYTIGDEIVCIESHKLGIVKEGQVFICKGLQEDCCKKCGGYIVDVGFKGKSLVECKYFIQCPNCNSFYSPILNDGKWWLRATRFRKLDTLVDTSELTEVLENNKPFELPNK